MKVTIKGLFTGLPAPLGDKGKMTAIVKQPVDKIIINKEALPGDLAADTKHHGGEDRVIHHYSQVQYNYLKSIFPEHASLFVPGSYGENIFTEELTEVDLCIGDMFKLGSALIQITEPRNPCGTIDLRYGFRGVLKEILKSRKYGWFYRVLTEGEVKLEDSLELKERPYPYLLLDKLIFEANQNKDKDLEFLKRAASCPALSKRYKTKLAKYLN